MCSCISAPLNSGECEKLSDLLSPDNVLFPRSFDTVTLFEGTPDTIAYSSPFAQSTSHILNCKLPVEMRTSPQPLQDACLPS